MDISHAPQVSEGRPARLARLQKPRRKTSQETLAGSAELAKVTDNVEWMAG